MYENPKYAIQYITVKSKLKNINLTYQKMYDILILCNKEYKMLHGKKLFSTDSYNRDYLCTNNIHDNIEIRIDPETTVEEYILELTACVVDYLYILDNILDLYILKEDNDNIQFLYLAT